MARIRTAQSQMRTSKRGSKRGPGTFSSTRAKAGLGGPTRSGKGAIDSRYQLGPVRRNETVGPQNRKRPPRS